MRFVRWKQIGYKKSLIAVIMILTITFSFSGIIVAMSIIDTNEINNLKVTISISNMKYNITNFSLTITKSKLNQTEKDFNSAMDRVSELIQENNNITYSLNITTSQLRITESNLKDTRIELNQTIKELSLARSGTTYTLHDPTYDEMKDFLSADDTDNKTYETGFYVCRHFARDVRNNANVLGIRSAYVEFYGPNENYPDQNSSLWKGHAMVGFETTDKGFIYIEPQSDDEYDIQMNGVCKHIIIKDLLIIW